MRYVPSLPPTPSVAEGEEPRRIHAVRPVRRVEPRSRVPLVIQHFRGIVKAEEAEAGPTPVRVEKRRPIVRRELCRRLQHIHPFLDTRSHVERRRRKRRRSDLTTTLDEEG